MTDTLDPAIDYDRFASLPAGVPPATLAAAIRRSYFRALGLEVSFHAYGLSAPAAATDRPPDSDEPLAPQYKAAEWMRVRSAGAAGYLVPRTVVALDAAQQTVRVELAKKPVEDARVSWRNAPALAAGDAAATIALKVARTHGFDDEGARASGLPIPFYPDDALILSWRAGAAPAPPALPAAPGALTLAVDAAGAVSVASLDPGVAATHLLTTPKDAWSGELDPLLLRAPVFGALRFERYRHLTWAGGMLTLANPSAAGRLVLRGIDRDPAPHASKPLVVEAQTFVFENVARDAAQALLTGILAHQVFNLTTTLNSGGDLVDRPVVRKIASTHLTTLFRAWFAYTRSFVVLPAGFAAHAQDIRNRADAGLKKCVEIAASLVASSQGQDSFLEFLESVYAPILCGATWAELLIPLPVPANREPRKSSAVDHAVLAELPRSSSTWTLVYAGCPIGRPAPVYAPTATPPVEELLRKCYGTFEVEALHLAGLANGVFGLAAPAPPAGLLAEVDLAPFSAKATGRASAFRIVEQHTFQANYGRVQQFSTRDWLLATARGTTRRFYEPPLVDLAPDAGGALPAGERHPLAALVQWHEFETSRAMWTLTSDAHFRTKVGLTALHTASLNWWVERSGMRSVDGAGRATWPAVTPADGDTRTTPSPRLPFAPSATVGRGAIADSGTKGLDYFDYEAIRAALGAVRDGATYQTIHPSLLLALSEREGYWTTIRRDRVGDFTPGITTRGDWSPGWPDRSDLRRTLSVAEWLLFPFGLDLLVNRVARHGTPLQPSAAWIDATVTQFEDVIALLTTSTSPCDTTKAILDAEKLPRALLRDYLERAVEIRWGTGAGDRNQLRVLSRRTQWVGLALQLAVFQLVHRLICTGEAFPTDPAAVKYKIPPEFIAPPPIWSAGANAASRRDYVTYHALVYLAFNTSAVTFNRWVDAANAEVQRRRVANPGFADPISRILVLWKNTTPDGIEPAGSAGRMLGQRGNMMRFAAGLDAYARLDFDGGTVEADDPADRTFDPVWQITGGP